LKLTLNKVAAVRVNDAVLVVPFRLAETVAVETAVTPVVAIVNVPVVDPAGTVTVGGTLAGAPETLRVTGVPPAGAATPSVTVPDAELPPTTLVGETLIETKVSD
jgi:hypothetical protein